MNGANNDLVGSNEIELDWQRSSEPMRIRMKNTLASSANENEDDFALAIDLDKTLWRDLLMAVTDQVGCDRAFIRTGD